MAWAVSCGHVSRRSETELQSELQLARVERTACLAEWRIVQIVESRRPCRSAQLEVGVIENVERFCAELQAEPVGELEGLEDGSIRCPVSRPDKSVATQIAYATQWENRANLDPILTSSVQGKPTFVGVQRPRK